MRRWTRGRDRHSRLCCALESQRSFGRYYMTRQRCGLPWYSAPPRRARNSSERRPCPGRCAVRRGSLKARRSRSQHDAPRRRSMTRHPEAWARSRRVSAVALVLTAVTAALKRITARVPHDLVRKQMAATAGGAAACCRAVAFGDWYNRILGKGQLFIWPAPEVMRPLEADEEGQL